MLASPVRGEQTVRRQCYRDPRLIATFWESARQEVDRVPPLQVAEDRAVPGALAKRPVVDAQDARDRPVEFRGATDASQQGIGARRHTHTDPGKIMPSLPRNRR